jgi:Nucleoside 2-deoxyribosyltransferase/pfkB family carbohydrate kinase
MYVVGGTYFEVCREPDWNELFGSGFRAAAAISGLDPHVRLSTYVSERDQPTLDSYADAYRVSVEAHTAPQTLRFSYVHGLSRPWIDPPLHLLTTQPPIEVEGETILRYGMLEGDALVRGERVVYDPQSTYDPRPFHQNGSEANRLAIVANRREGEAMTGRKDIDEIGRSLRDDQHAEVVLIKRGAAGVRVFHPGGAEDVPAFRTDRVFPIGSGDVYSAIFAHYWATNGADPLLAAEAASRATAWYCSTRLLPIPDDPSTELRGPIRPSNGGHSPKRVYLAGPFFTTTDRWLVAEARDGLIQQHVHVFSPFHDIGIGPAEVVVPKDIAELRECDAVLAILDGFDAGTSFEVGFARSLGVPVVAFVQNEPPEPLKMLVGTGCEIVDDLVSAVYRAAWAAMER